MKYKFVRLSHIYIPEEYLNSPKLPTSPFDKGVFLPLGYKDIIGKRIPINEIINKLSKFNLTDVIKALAGINLFLRVHGAAKHATQREIAETFLSENTRKQIDNAIKKQIPKYHIPPRGFVLFHRSQLLLLMQRAFLVCDFKRGRRLKEKNTKDFHLLGELCLMINDYIHYNIPSEEDSDYEKAKNLAVELLLTAEMDNDPFWIYELARGDYLLRDCWIASELNPLNIFHERTGLTIDEFRAFVFALFGMFEKNIRPDGMLNFAINRDKFLQNTHVPVERMKLLLKLMSKEYKELPDEINKQNTEYPEKSFMAFRRFPIIRFGRESWCADSGFIMERVTTGLFWQIHDILNDNERDVFHSGWGYAFQKYVDNVFGVLYPPQSGIFYTSPIYRDGKELADGLLYDGKRIAILEYKGVPLSIHQKYRRNTRDFFKALEAKLFADVSKPQLAKNIRRIFQSPEGKEALKKLRIDVSKIQTIMPVIICYERAVLAPFVHDYLQRRFKEKAGGLPNGTADLAILNISGLEMMRGYKGSKTLLQLIEEKTREPRLRARSLDSKIEEVLNESGIKPRNKELDDRSKKLLDGMGLYFFGSNNKQ